MNTPTATTNPANVRLMSLEALRGFGMIWILGADAVLTALARFLHRRQICLRG